MWLTCQRSGAARAAIAQPPPHRRRRRGSAMPIDLILCHGTSLRPFSSERLVLFNDDSGGGGGGGVIGGGVLWTRFFLPLWQSFYSARLGYLDKL